MMSPDATYPSSHFAFHVDPESVLGVSPRFTVSPPTPRLEGVGAQVAFGEGSMAILRTSAAISGAVETTARRRRVLSKTRYWGWVLKRR
jgi:hypothetical protein